MSCQALRSKLIRLAHAKPELRPMLMPLLKTAATITSQPEYESFFLKEQRAFKDREQQLDEQYKKDKSKNKSEWQVLKSRLDWAGRASLEKELEAKTGLKWTSSGLNQGGLFTAPGVKLEVYFMSWALLTVGRRRLNPIDYKEFSQLATDVAAKLPLLRTAADKPFNYKGFLKALQKAIAQNYTPPLVGASIEANHLGRPELVFQWGWHFESTLDWNWDKLKGIRKEVAQKWGVKLHPNVPVFLLPDGSNLPIRDNA